MHITTTLDPISLKDVPKDPKHRLQEENLDIYFESIENMNAYKNMHVERSGTDLNHSLDNPTEEAGTDWN